MQIRIGTPNRESRFAVEAGDEPAIQTNAPRSDKRAAIHSLPHAEQSRAIIRMIDVAITTPRCPCVERLRALRQELRDGQPMQQLQFERFASLLDQTFAARASFDQPPPDNSRDRPSDMFTNLQLMASRLLGFAPQGIPMHLHPRRDPLHALGPMLAQQLRTGGFALLSGQTCGGLHAISITRVNGAFCWHDTRAPELGQRRTFTAPSVESLLAAVEAANARGDYDFSIVVPRGTPEPSASYSAVVFNHPMPDGSNAASRFAEMLSHGALR